MPALFTSFTVLLSCLPTPGRRALTRLLELQPGMSVIDAGEDSAALVRLARQLRPGLVILEESQVRVLEQLSGHLVVPTLLYCEVPPLAGMLREVSSWGVFDFLLAGSSPTDWLLKICRKLPPAPVRPQLRDATRLAAIPNLPSGVVVIGGSTGGTAAVEQVVRALPATLACAVIVAVHLPASFLDSFVKRLARVTTLPVVAGWAGTQLAPGRIIVAPGGCNMLVRAGANSPWQSWQTDFSTEINPSGDEPSIDMLMRSVARLVGNNALGVVLTGLGRDGTLGAQAIRQHGGAVLAQDEATSAVFSMPKSVIQAGWASAVLPLIELAPAIARHASKFRRVVAGVRSVSPFTPRIV